MKEIFKDGLSRLECILGDVDKLEVIDKDLFVRDLDKILRFRDEIS